MSICVVVIKAKSSFFYFSIYFSGIFELAVWDKDTFTEDDFIGKVQIPDFSRTAKTNTSTNIQIPKMAITNMTII